LRLFSFGGYGLALAALALVVFGAIECPPNNKKKKIITFTYSDVETSRWGQTGSNQPYFTENQRK